MAIMLAVCVCVCIYPQDRRREFEANLEKEGLELETEDKSVRDPTTEYLHHLVDSLLRRTTFSRKSLKGIAHIILPSKYST